MSGSTVHPLTLFQLLSQFRRELNGVLSELNALSSAHPADVDQSLRDLHEELRRAIYQLESTLDFLIPLDTWGTEPPQLPISE